MAWIDLEDNQIPNYTDLSTSGLTLKSGQSHVTSTECPNKLQLNTKYSLSPSLLSSYADNQLVPKSNLASAGSFRHIRFVSSRTRLFQYTINNNSVFQTIFIASEFCGDFNKTQTANALTTSSISVQLAIDGNAISEAIEWSFRILDNATKTTVYYSNIQTVFVQEEDYETTFTITGLTAGFDYYYEGIAISTSCLV
jgi:hypothetical protein